MFCAAGMRVKSDVVLVEDVADQRLERLLVDRALDQRIELFEQLIGGNLAAGHQVEKVVAVGRVGFGGRAGRQDVELQPESHVVAALST